MSALTIGDRCECDHDYDIDLDPDEEPSLFKRMCWMCGFVWGSGHCPHDLIQNRCPGCGFRPPGTTSFAQRMGVEPIYRGVD